MEFTLKERLICWNLFRHHNLEMSQNLKMVLERKVVLLILGNTNKFIQSKIIDEVFKEEERESFPKPSKVVHLRVGR